MKEFSYFTNDWTTRVNLCNRYEKLFEKKYAAHNLQNVKTPNIIIRKMIDKASSLKDKKILVLFNFEFIDSLIHDYKVDPSNLYFVADCHQDMCKVIKKMYNLSINNIVHHGEFKDGSLTKVLGKMSMKFDLCITNPPYNRGLDLKILDSVKDICDEIICIHPSMWLLDIKGNRESFGTLKNSVKIKDLEFFNGNPIFNIFQNLPIVITHIDKTYNGNIQVNWFGSKFNCNNINDVTKYSNNWQTIVKPFYEKVKDISEKDNILKHNKKYNELINKDYIVQIAYIRGNVSNDEYMITDDFYTIVMRGDENLGIRQIVETPPYFEFNTKDEQINYLNYLKTDFVRFCLSIYKNNGHIISGGISRLIPWLDFTQGWTDEKLFTRFEIDQATQEYIRKFLPDYYNLRK